ncbi:uncharacterized protein NPIL_616641 [Nephila pilipes]|uniref:Gustatory receptor n=1 Tax=Nephila pilipes TaxID=299642 RepID=A0A8X6P5S9_NEPPI|nr:uncharacterized protein NPIL_616641 [Nephila pilipes]
MSNFLRKQLTPELIFELCSNGSTGLLMMFFLTTCCSRIPDYMLRIKTKAKVLMDNQVLLGLEGSKNMYLLNRIAEKDTIYLSAGGLLDFKRSFIFSTFGTIFTYGLLILNLNRIS